MPRIKVLPHAQICPTGAEFEVEPNANLCESLLKNGPIGLCSNNIFLSFKSELSNNFSL